MMVDLNYGENYQEEILLKNKIEEKISSLLGVPKEQVMLNYGSNSNIIMFFSAFSIKFLKEKKRSLKVLLDFPNYFFTISQLKEWYVKYKFVQRDKEMELPINSFIRQIKLWKPDVVLLTTPNNPTGKAIKDSDIKKIIKATSNKTIILIDRSCVNVLPEIPTRDLLKIKDKKIVILHSFSKSHSLSDERLGYLVTNNKDIAKFLYNKRDLNHNINAVKKLLKVIENEKIVKKKKKIIEKCSLLLKNFCKRRNIKYFESFSNFALIKLPKSITSDYVENYLRKRNILVMNGHKIGLGKNYIRLHMTGINEIKSFIKEFEKIIK